MMKKILSNDVMYSKGSEYMRRFLLSNTLNTRDLGGYTIDCGRVTAYKAFLRSDVPIQVSDDDIKLLLSNNITTIVDLRSDDETQSKPCALKITKISNTIIAKYMGMDIYLEVLKKFLFHTLKW